MRKSDVTCPECGAGFRRIELTSQPGIEGQYRCPTCDTVLENLSGSDLVTYRLTVQPSIRALHE
jgi:transposase-like protein